jgi:hypothetical protein
MLTGLLRTEQTSADLSQRRCTTLVHLAPTLLGVAPERLVSLQKSVDEAGILGGNQL